MDFEKFLDSALMVGILFVVVVFGVLAGLLAWDFVGPEPIIQSDFNSTLLDEKLAARDVINIFDEKGAIIRTTTRPQMLVDILGSFAFIQEQRLCGTNTLVPDSNRLNEIPAGIVYSCFAPTEAR